MTSKVNIERLVATAQERFDIASSFLFGVDRSMVRFSNILTNTIIILISSWYLNNMNGPGSDGPRLFYVTIFIFGLKVP